MTINIFTIRDTKISYRQPIFSHSAETIIRDLRKIANEPGNQISTYIEDLQLFRIGTFDDATGKITTSEEPEFIINLIDLKEVKNNAGEK